MPDCRKPFDLNYAAAGVSSSAPGAYLRRKRLTASSLIGSALVRASPLLNLILGGTSPLDPKRICQGDFIARNFPLPIDERFSGMF